MLFNIFLATPASENWNFSIDNFQTVWYGLIQVAILLLALVLGNLLRNVIPFLRKSLIPSALIGGVLLLITLIILDTFGIEIINERFMQIITYHGLGIGFVAMTLKTIKAKKKVGIGKVVDASLFCGSMYLMQAAVGLLITILLFVIVKKGFYASGAIMALGFAQGPGNALIWDINYTTDYPTLFSGNGSFGLTIASIGFIVSAVVGVSYINVQRIRGKIHIREKNDARMIAMYEDENEIPASESIDKFTVQLGIVGIGYAMAFGIMAFLSIWSFTKSLAWGFNFLFGVFAAMLIKLVLKGLKKVNVVKRHYINNYQMDRIAGFAFDIMIVAGVAAIDIENVKEYALPIVLLAVFGTIITFGYTLLVSKLSFKGYSDEFFVMNFGTLTGTASNGMILLKEIDPNLETPTSDVYISSQLGNIITASPLLLLMAFMGKSLKNSIIALIIFAVLIIIYNIVLFRRYIFKKHYEGKEEKEWIQDEETVGPNEA